VILAGDIGATKTRLALFVKAFVAKGRMRPLLEAMPVRVVLNDRLALLGSARYAVSEATAG